ncbi:MAG: hypothetical protein PUC12_08660 [Clostridiales bacterium]|nr:hypothetical protein [Clostridiales bacterium]
MTEGTGNMLKFYQVTLETTKENIAGSKAVSDISEIACGVGFEKKKIIIFGGCSLGNKIKRQIKLAQEWENVYDSIDANSVLLLQHPFGMHHMNRSRSLRRLKKEKKIHVISMVHDVESLRKIFDNNCYKREFSLMIELADILIVHNKRMAEYFTKIGVPSNKIVILGIFDYLQQEKLQHTPSFAKQINIAGNLDVKKSPYIAELGKLENVEIKLYGPNFDNKINNYTNVKYEGCFLPHEIPQKLISGFGVVWDGTSIESCQGPTGEYLKYNNPYKLSLYLSAGLPVVIWSEAAEAEFVLKHHAGIAVRSLCELTDIFSYMTEAEYNELARGARRVADKLRTGQYTLNALNTAINIIETEEGKE